MLKGYFIAWLGVMAAFFSAAQTVTPVLINVNQLAQNELLHPPLLKPCVECNAEETDGGWRGLQDMPLPKGANIKTQFITQTLRPQNPNTPLLSLRSFRRAQRVSRRGARCQNSAERFV